MIATNQHHTVAELRRVPVKRPNNVGGRWRGVNHGELLIALIDYLKPVPKTLIHLHRDGGVENADMTAVLLPKETGAWPNGLAAALGVTANNAKKRGLAFYGGAVAGEVPLVTSRYAADGDQKMVHWRYEETFDLPRVVEEVIDWWLGELRQTVATYSRLTKTRITDEMAKDILTFQATNSRLIPWLRVPVAMAAWTENEDKTAWGLVRAFWAAARLGNPDNQMQTMFRFTQATADLSKSKLRRA